MKGLFDIFIKNNKFIHELTNRKSNDGFTSRFSRKQLITSFSKRKKEFHPNPSNFWVSEI